MTRDRFGSVHPSKKRSRHLHRAVIPRQCSQFSRASNSLKRVKNYLLLCSVRSRRRRKLRFSIASRNLCLDLEMAAALSSKFLKGIASLHSLRSTRLASASYVNQNGMMRYSTTVPSDSDTHDDFKPTQKVPSGSTDSLKDIVENDVKENPVMIYMKGVPEAPQYENRNILEDQELKNAVKSFSHWPTFPQIFIKGEFIGGSDIILNMHKEGELEEKLKDVSGSQKSQ
ncbi:monothiol glutaredoxin-S15, mitochondrial isoform X2 [Raphanus sativus]|uniref:Monothiol glutaredoxin-S15, mitochondrial isoform X2 n=1 Tax=Raphanus sativus TaxID=3726 RepID=A0A6J0JD64_RAPSA|nr:monothiol glutaredoxin-S15, mitochondrial isoform X2 [Raphanus sativus]